MTESNSFGKNRLCQVNQKELFREINGDNKVHNIAPDAQMTREFWSNIWERETRHNDEAEWIKNVEEELKREQQTNVTTSVDALKKLIAMMANWKAPGPDGIQGYWIKTFRSLHERLATQLMTCLEKGEVPIWMTHGRTVLIMKGESKSAITDL